MIKYEIVTRNLEGKVQNIFKSGKNYFTRTMANVVLGKMQPTFNTELWVQEINVITDEERLEWMAMNQAFLRFDEKKEHFWVRTDRHPLAIGFGPSYREAIDTAMRDDAREIIAKWIQEEYETQLKNLDAFVLPEKIVKARDLLGREAFANMCRSFTGQAV